MMNTYPAQPIGNTAAYSSFSDSTFQPLSEDLIFGNADSYQLSQDWDCVLDELLRIRSLEDDWDGEGTEAPKPALVDSAITFTQFLRGKRATPPDRVHAGVNATIYFEWHSPLYYCEMEVVSPVDVECRNVSVESGETVSFRFSFRS